MLLFFLIGLIYCFSLGQCGDSSLGNIAYAHLDMRIFSFGWYCKLRPMTSISPFWLRNLPFDFVVDDPWEFSPIFFLARLSELILVIRRFQLLADIDISCPMTSLFSSWVENLLLELEIYWVRLKSFFTFLRYPCFISINRVDSWTESMVILCPMLFSTERDGELTDSALALILFLKRVEWGFVCDEGAHSSAKTSWMGLCVRWQLLWAMTNSALALILLLKRVEWGSCEFLWPTRILLPIAVSDMLLTIQNLDG